MIVIETDIEMISFTYLYLYCAKPYNSGVTGSILSSAQFFPSSNGSHCDRTSDWKLSPSPLILSTFCHKPCSSIQ